MTKNRFEIFYRRILVVPSWLMITVHEDYPDFCFIDPYFINYHLGDEEGYLLCDSEFIVRLPDSFMPRGVVLSQRVDPTERVIDMVHQELFY